MSAAAPRGVRAGTTGPVPGRFRFPPVLGGPFRSLASPSGPRMGHGLSAPSDPEPARSGLPEMASREGLAAASRTWGSGTGGTLTAVTWLAGSLPYRFRRAFVPGSSRGFPALGVGTGCKSHPVLRLLLPILQQLLQTRHRSWCVRSLDERSAEVHATVPVQLGRSLL